MTKKDYFAKLLLGLLVFAIPVQLGYHFWPNWSHIFGIRVDYFSPTLYLTDIVSLLFVFFRWERIQIFRFRKLFLFLLVFAGINTLFAVNIPVALYKWIKVSELLLLVLAIKSYSLEQLKYIITKPLAISLTIFSLIGIFQFISGHTIGGLFRFLGERSFNLSTPGIALERIFNRNWLRAYSTFGHPNAFAGYLVISLLIYIWCKGRSIFRSVSDMSTTILAVIAFVLTFSLSATVAVFTISIFYIFKKYSRKLSISIFFLIIITSIVLLIFSPIQINNRWSNNESVVKRLELVSAAKNMLNNKWIIGIGPGGFITRLPYTANQNNIRWWLQPVHNLYILVFVESGLVGFTLMAGGIYFLIKKPKFNLILLVLLTTILVTGWNDHYWLTLQQNQLLLSLVLGLSLV